MILLYVDRYRDSLLSTQEVENNDLHILLSSETTKEKMNKVEHKSAGRSFI